MRHSCHHRDSFDEKPSSQKMQKKKQKINDENEIKKNREKNEQITLTKNKLGGVLTINLRRNT